MARSTEPRLPPSPTSAGMRAMARVAAVLLGVAAALGAYLAFESWRSGTVPGCDAAGCGVVLSSKWSKILGLPVGGVGAALYATLAWLASWKGWRRTPWVQGMAATLALLVPAAAGWFAALQLFVLKAFCPWCSGTHLLATTGAILFLLDWKRTASAPATQPAPAGKASRRTPLPPASPPWGIAATMATLLGIAFAAAQALGPEAPRPKIRTVSMDGAPRTVTPASAAASAERLEPTRVVTSDAVNTNASAASPARTVVKPTARDLVLHDGRFHLNPYELPILGNPDAKHLIVMVSDYTCKHCRAAHRILHDVRDSFGPDELGVVMMPSHHGGDSEELQRMMLATWRANPAVWTAVADDLYSERHALEPASVRATLNQKLGPGILAQSMSNQVAWTTNLIAFSRSLYLTNKAKANSGSIPQFVIGSEIVVGAPEDAAEFYQLFERNLGLVRDRLPILGLIDDAVDLGKSFAGTSKALSIPYTNSGRAPLRISRVNLPPGGRVLRGINQPIAPGQTSAVEVAVLIPREDGPFDQRIVMYSNGRTNASTIRLSGQAWKPLRITPSYLDFGRLEPSNGATQGVLHIEFLEDAVLESVRSANPGYTATLREVKPGREYAIAVATTAALGRGVQQASLIALLRKPVPPGWPESLAFGVRAVVDSAVSVVPPRLIFSNATLATEQHYQLLVRCGEGCEGFTVTDAVLEGGPSVTRPEVRPGTGASNFVVVLTLPAGWNPNASPAGTRLVVHTTHPKYPEIEVPFATAETEAQPAAR